MAIYRQDLHDIIEPAVKAVGYELFGCELRSGEGGSLLRVYIDSPHGISIEDCEKASRQISAILDVEDPIRGNYTLEVSSPGLERPLFSLAHYQQYVGKKVNIKLLTPIEKRRVFVGTIKQVVGQNIELVLEDKQNVSLAFNNIAKANLVFEIEVKKKPGK